MSHTVLCFCGYILAGKNCWNYYGEEDGDCRERRFCFLSLDTDVKIV